MPTVIDSLIVSLGLDSKGLASGAKDSTQKMRALEDQIESTKNNLDQLNKTSDKKSEGYKKEQALLIKQLDGYKQQQKAMKRANEDAKQANALQKESAKGYENVTSGAVKFLAVLGSAVAVKSFVSDAIQANYQISQLSMNLGTTAEALSAGGNAAKLFGGSAQDALNFSQMLGASKYQLFRGSGAMPPIGRFYTQIGMGMGEFEKEPEDQLLDIQSHIQGAYRKNGKFDRTMAYQGMLAGGVPISYANMILSTNAAELKQMLDRLKISQQEIDEQAKLATASRLLSIEFTKLGYDILQVFSPVIDWLDKWSKKLSKMDAGERNAILGSVGLGGTVASLTIGSIAMALMKMIPKLLWGGIKAAFKAPGKLIRGLAGRGAAAEAGEVAGEGAVIAGEAEAGAIAAPETMGLSLIVALVAIVCTAVVAWMATHWDTVKQLAGKAGNAVAQAWHATSGYVGKAGNAVAQAWHATSGYVGKVADKVFQSRAMRFFEGKGWTTEQSAGLVAGVGRESGGRANQQEIGGGKGYGLAQWGPARQAEFKKWSGHDIHNSTEDEQLEFMNYELTQGKEKKAGQLLRGARTASEAGAIASYAYERPGDRYGEAMRRARDAQALMGVAGASRVVQDPSYTSVLARGGNNTTTSIGEVHVHTQATDAPGIAKDMKNSLGYEFTAHANGGLQ